MRKQENRIIQFIYKKEDYLGKNVDEIPLQIVSAISNKYNNKGTIYIVEKTEDLIENYAPIEYTKMIKLSNVSENIITDNSSNINHIFGMVNMLSERTTSEAPLIIYINNFLDTTQFTFKHNKDLNNDPRNYTVLDLFEMVVTKISNDKNIFIIFNNYMTSPIRPEDKYTREQLFPKELKPNNLLEIIEVFSYICRVDKKSKEITNFIGQTYFLDTKYEITVLKNRIMKTDNSPVYTINSLFTNIPDILNTLKITKAEGQDNDDIDLQKEMRGKIKVSFNPLYQIAIFKFNDENIFISKIKTEIYRTGKMKTAYIVPNFVYNKSTENFECSSFMYKIADAHEAMKNGYVDSISFDDIHGIFDPICTKETDSKPTLCIPNLDNIVYGYTILIKSQYSLSKEYYIINDNNVLRDTSDFSISDSMRIYDIAIFFKNIEDAKDYIDKVRKEKIDLSYEGYRVRIDKEDEFKIIQSVRFS